MNKVILTENNDFVEVVTGSFAKRIMEDPEFEKEYIARIGMESTTIFGNQFVNILSEKFRCQEN